MKYLTLAFLFLATAQIATAQSGSSTNTCSGGVRFNAAQKLLIGVEKNYNTAITGNKCIIADAIANICILASEAVLENNCGSLNVDVNAVLLAQKTDLFEEVLATSKATNLKLLQDYVSAINDCLVAEIATLLETAIDDSQNNILCTITSIINSKHISLLEANIKINEVDFKNTIIWDECFKQIRILVVTKALQITDMCECK